MFYTCLWFCSGGDVRGKRGGDMRGKRGECMVKGGMHEWIYYKGQCDISKLHNNFELINLKPQIHWRLGGDTRQDKCQSFLCIS